MKTQTTRLLSLEKSKEKPEKLIKLKGNGFMNLSQKLIGVHKCQTSFQ